MGRSSGRPILFWFGVVLLVALISLVVDQTTGDTTPPYHDPPINQVAFFIFFASIPTLVVLAGVALVRFVRRAIP